MSLIKTSWSWNQVKNIFYNPCPLYSCAQEVARAGSDCANYTLNFTDNKQVGSTGFSYSYSVMSSCLDTSALFLKWTVISLDNQENKNQSYVFCKARYRRRCTLLCPVLRQHQWCCKSPNPASQHRGTSEEGSRLYPSLDSTDYEVFVTK